MVVDPLHTALLPAMFAGNGLTVTGTEVVTLHAPFVAVTVYTDDAEGNA